MKKIFSFITALSFIGCAGESPRTSFQSAPSAIDRRIESATIEDYILALPPFSFHEETAEDFRARVREARSLPQNTNKSRDFLYCGGDGSWPAKEFTLDRPSRTLVIKIHPGEGSPTPQTVRMKRVRSGWVREDISA